MEGAAITEYTTGRRRRTSREIELEVMEFCRWTPRKQTEIIRACGIDTKKLKQLARDGIIEIYKIVTSGTGSYRGIKYYITSGGAIEDLQRNI